MEDESLVEDLERLEKKFPAYNRMKLKEREAEKYVCACIVHVYTCIYIDAIV